MIPVTWLTCSGSPDGCRARASGGAGPWPRARLPRGTAGPGHGTARDVFPAGALAARGSGDLRAGLAGGLPRGQLAAPLAAERRPGAGPPLGARGADPPGGQPAPPPPGDAAPATPPPRPPTTTPGGPAV